MADVRDPVCTMECSNDTAVMTDFQGKKYYFCSEGCRDKFLEEHTCALPRRSYELVIVGGGPAARCTSSGNLHIREKEGVLMKKLVVMIGLAAGLIAATAYAQMGGQGSKAGPGSMMGTQSQQMMSPEMMKDMSGTMNHMIEMMQMMSHNMGHRTISEHMKMSDMAGVMEDMSLMMHDMSQRMAKGAMSPADSKQMRDRINEMQKRMKAIEKPEK